MPSQPSASIRRPAAPELRVLCAPPPVWETLTPSARRQIAGVVADLLRHRANSAQPTEERDDDRV